MNHFFRTLAQALVLTWLMASTWAIAQPADYNESIAKARESIQKSQFTPALEAALQARKLNPKDFRSYYYEAMALLGQGKRDAALVAVQAAQERAPASAKPSLDKLAQMAADTGPEPAKETKPASSAVFVSCTYVETDLKDPPEVKERTSVYRLERGNFQTWKADDGEWDLNQCIFANTVVNAKVYSDIEHKCEVDEQRFKWSSEDLDDKGWKDSRSWSISRMSGKYNASRIYVKIKDGTRFGTTATGSCRPVKDPSADLKPKF
jgi:hypothetical protein